MYIIRRNLLPFLCCVKAKSAGLKIFFRKLFRKGNQISKNKRFFNDFSMIFQIFRDSPGKNDSDAADTAGNLFRTALP